MLEKKILNWNPNMYVSFALNGKWYIGFIQSIIETEMISTISCLQKTQKKMCRYTWPDRWPDIETCVDIAFTDILCNVTVGKEKENLFTVKLGRTLSKFEQYVANNC